MKNPRESKSARTAKAATTPADGGAPEVRVVSGTVAVLPNPADAPAPPKRGRPTKPAPTVATKAEVPDWAKRAAARDTAAEMAAVPEAPPVAEPTPPKRRRAAKPEQTPTARAAKPGSLRAVGTSWIDAIRKNGASASTVSSYGNDLEVAYQFLDGDAPASGITEKQIAAFDKCKAVLTKRNGKPKAQPTILKTRRALRLALTWAEEQKLIKKAPYPAA
jgi:hypothetical protein